METTIWVQDLGSRVRKEKGNKYIGGYIGIVLKRGCIGIIFPYSDLEPRSQG